MNLGALVDIGVPFNHIKNELSKLNLDNEFKITENKEIKKGIFGTKVKVIDLNNEYVHKLDKEKIGCGKKVHVHNHSHNDKKKHSHSCSRNYSQIKDIIEASNLNSNIKEKAILMFNIIAKAEGEIHNKPLEEVHFHEVGAIDSIVDIVGCAIAIDYLKVDKVVASPIEVGYGNLRCAHGIMPVPAPATIEILKGIDIKSENVPFEATTPTGAAIIKAYAEKITYNKEFNIKKIGYGIGEKDNINMANALRIILGEVNI